MSKIQNLNDLFVHGLKDVYYAEKQAVKSLSTMAEKATNSELATLLREHKTQSETQIERLEKVFELAGEKAEAVKCEAMDGILKEAKHLMEETPDPETRDAAIIFSAQAVEHYEITRYGSLATYAERLGMDEAADLLGDTLGEEEESDEKLSRLAEDKLNKKAV